MDVIYMKHTLLDWFYVAIGFSLIPILATFLYFRISGDLSVCKNYYPEMGRMECYFSSKTVRIPNAR